MSSPAGLQKKLQGQRGNTLETSPRLLMVQKNVFPSKPNKHKNTPTGPHLGDSTNNSVSHLIRPSSPPSNKVVEFPKVGVQLPLIKTSSDRDVTNSKSGAKLQPTQVLLASSSQKIDKPPLIPTINRIPSVESISDIPLGLDFETKTVSVPLRDGKLFMQVRRLKTRRRIDVDTFATVPLKSYGLIVQEIHHKSPVEGILQVGDEIIEAAGVSLIDHSPKHFARLLSEVTHENSINLVFRRRKPSTEAAALNNISLTQQRPTSALSSGRKEKLSRTESIAEEDEEIEAELVISNSALYVEPKPTGESITIERSLSSPTIKQKQNVELSARREINEPNITVGNSNVQSLQSEKVIDNEMIGSLSLHDQNEYVRKSDHLIISKSQPLPNSKVLDEKVSTQDKMDPLPLLEKEAPNERPVVQTSAFLPRNERTAQSSSQMQQVKIASSNVSNNKLDSPSVLPVSDGIKKTVSEDNQMFESPTLLPRNDRAKQSSNQMNSAKTVSISPDTTKFELHGNDSSFRVDSKSMQLRPRANTDHGDVSGIDVPSTPIASPYRISPSGKKRKRPATASSANKSPAQSLQLMATLSRPQSRAEARMDGQVLAIALRSLENTGEKIVELAARKIQLWSRLYVPRRQLRRRMELCRQIRGIVLDMMDTACGIGERKMRRKNKLLRNGAAATIQRAYRLWRDEYLFNVILLQQFFRHRLIRRKLLRIVCSVRAAILIYRWTRKSLKKYRVLVKVKKLKLLHKILHRYFDYVGFERRRHDQMEFVKKMGRMTSDNMLLQGRRKNLEVTRRDRAVVKIQSLYRGYRGRVLVASVRKTKYITRLLRSAIWVMIMKLRARRRMKEVAAAVKLQTRFRGMRERMKMYKRVVAGIKITQYWFKYKQYNKLKEYCRRIVRPIKIVLSELVDIPTQLVYTDNLKVKVSVWWSPLLHLMNKKDFSTIVKTRKPQYVTNSSVRHIVDGSSSPVQTSRPKLSFYNVASLRLNIEKSVALLDSEVYIGQSLFGKPHSSKVPFSIIKNNESVTGAAENASSHPDPADPNTESNDKNAENEEPSSAAEPAEHVATSKIDGHNWEEISGGGDIYRAAPLKPLPTTRKSSLRKISNTSAGSSSRNNSTSSSASGVAVAESPTLSPRDSDDEKRIKALEGPATDTTNSASLIVPDSSPSIKRKVSFNRIVIDQPLTNSIASSGNVITDPMLRQASHRTRAASGSSVIEADPVSSSGRRRVNSLPGILGGEMDSQVVPHQILAPLPIKTEDQEPEKPVTKDDLDITVGNTSITDPKGDAVKIPRSRSLETLPKSAKSSDKQSDIEALKQKPTILRALSRRVSSARLATEYNSKNNDDSDQLPAISSKKSKKNDVKQVDLRSLNVPAGSHRKSSIFDKISEIGENLVESWQDFTSPTHKSSYQRVNPRKSMTGGKSTLLKCNFEDEAIYIPGCHGNSVIKFDFFDGDRRLGSAMFHLGGVDEMMFWGGSYTSELEINRSRRVVQLDQSTMAMNDRNRSSASEKIPTFKFKVIAGTALKSKCDWCRACFKGPSSSHGVMELIGVVSSLFEKWHKYYASVDGQYLRFYESKSSTEALFSINATAIKTMSVELSGIDRLAAKQSKLAFIEDIYTMILITNHKDEIHIKFASSTIREQWEYVIDKIIESRESGSIGNVIERSSSARKM